MAINPLLPILIGEIQTRNTIKDRNEEAYDEATGNFIDIASAEFFRDQTEQKKRIDTNKKFYDATENRYGTNVAEFAAKSNLFDGYTSPLQFLKAIEAGDAMPVEFRKKLTGATKDGKVDDTFFKSQGFKTTFAQDQTLAKKKLTNRATFAAQNLNKGAISNLADLYLKDTEATPPPERGPISSFLFGKDAPSTTALVGGFEKGLEQAEEKATLDTEPAAMTTSTDAKLLATDTSLIDKKIGFEKAIDIGSTGEVDSAIANVFNLKQTQIGPDGIIFPEAYRLRALAIKDIARDMVQSGAYETRTGIDSDSLVRDAAAVLESKYFSTLPKAFSMYGFASKIGDGPGNAKAEYAIDKDNRATLGDNFVAIFGKYIDNPNTPETETFSKEDLLLKQTLKESTGRTKGAAKMATSGSFIISQNAYNAIKAFINNMPNDAIQKAYIQYLPKNLVYAIPNSDAVVSIHDRLNNSFGFTSF